MAKKNQLGIVEPIIEKYPNPSFSQMIPAGSQTKVNTIASTISGKSLKKRKDADITKVGKIAQIKEGWTALGSPGQLGSGHPAISHEFEQHMEPKSEVNPEPMLPADPAATQRAIDAELNRRLSLP